MAGFLTWLRSSLHGEVSTAELSMRRGAGTSAYSLFDEACAAVGDDRGTCLFRGCAWNAFALQTIADTLIDVDAADDPGTAGYVPRSTLRFASSCFDLVPDWIRRARVVQSDPDAHVTGLPAKLPVWTADEPTRPGELRALRAAYEALEARAESDLQVFVGRADATSHAVSQAHRLRAEMDSAAEYADALAPRNAGPADRGEARWRLLSALESAFQLGQLLAVPALAELGLSSDADESPLALSASWRQIAFGWPVTDAEGVMVGHVRRVLGDRDTGAFEGLEIDGSMDGAPVRIPASSVAAIHGGEVKLLAGSKPVGVAD